MQDAKLPELLTVKQAAKYFKVHTLTIRRWIYAGTLQHIRIGRKYLIPRKSLPK